MKLRHLLIIITTVLICICFGIVSYVSYNLGVDYGEQNAESIRSKKINNSDTRAKKEKIVTVVKAKNIFNQHIIKSSGRVSALQNITKTSEVQGEIEGILSLKKGRIFQKGDILFSLKNTDFSLLLEAKKSRFLRLISINLADIKLDFPQEYTKWEIFFNEISTNNPLPDFPEYTTSKEKNFIISKSILSEYKSIQSDEERIKKYTVYAPFNGSIARSYTNIGASVNPGSPIIDIISDGLMEIELPINQSEVDKVNIGNTVQLIDGDNIINARIVRKGQIVDIATQNISVFAETSSNKKMYAGMYLDAIIMAKDADMKTVNIPRRSIFGDNNIYIVSNDNKLQVKKIKIHSSNINTVNVTGVDDNTLIVSEPIINAKEGMQVKPIFKN